MRNLKLMLGITAFVAVMSLLMVSCKEEPISAPPPDAIFRLSADYGAYTTYPISATVIDLKLEGVDKPIPFPKTWPAHSITTVPNYTPNVVIFWVKTSADIYQNWLKAQDPTQTSYNDAEYQTYLSGLTSTTSGTFYNQLASNSSSGNTSTQGRLFKPADATSYIAGIVDYQSFKDWVAPATGVTPGTCPTPLFAEKPIPVADVSSIDSIKASYAGKWEMGYFFEPSDRVGAGKIGKELVKIGPDTFRLFLNQEWIDKGEHKGYEGIQFAIKADGWKQITGTALTITETPNRRGVPDPNNGNPQTTVTFDSGYTLEIKEVTLNQGYTDYTEFNVYQKTGGTSYLSRTNQSGASVVRSNLTRTPPEHANNMTEDWTVTGESAPTNPNPSQ